MNDGHTFLPNDRDFAIIEKRKQVDKVYVPQDRFQVLKLANVVNPFTVTEMTQQDIFDFNPSWPICI